MKFYIGVTDPSWFHYLSQIAPEDVNFWQPGGRTSFKVISPGAPFLFKLKRTNKIAGVGFFSSHTFLPISIAWEIFEDRNGLSSFSELNNTIKALRDESNNLSKNPNIGCIILTNPIFFHEEDWIEVPSDWKQSIQQGKSYSTSDRIGKDVWGKIEILLAKYSQGMVEESKNPYVTEDVEPEYRKILARIRVGQGAFRIMITDAYSRRCAISGERTLPVLEAAHIKPITSSGPYHISNGLLLRSDIHKLFDRGYITLTSDFKIEVSKRIKEEFENGREYYKFHGSELVTLPFKEMDKPSPQFIDWHNTNIYKG